MSEERESRMRAVAVAGWIVIFGVLFLWQGFGLAWGPPWPTLSDMFRAFMRPVLGAVGAVRPVAVAGVAPVHPGLGVLHAEPPVTVRTVVAPVLSAYALFVVLALYAARHPVARPPRSEPLTARTLARFFRYVAVLEAGGYVVMLAIVLVFGVVIVGGDGELWSAAWSGLFLLAVATPVFALLSWAEGRWRRLR